MNQHMTFFAKLYVVVGFMAGISIAFFTLAMFMVDDPRNASWKYLFLLAIIAIFYSVRVAYHKLRVKNQSSFYRFNCDNFQPNPDYEMNRWDRGEYIGIDTKHGTMLMASAHKKLFKGKNIKELAGYECRGEILTLKFNDIEFPTFVINAGTESKCMAFGHKLDVLLSPSYQPAVNVGSAFNDFVRQKSLA